MDNLTLEAVCEGALAVHSNAKELLKDAQFLRGNGRNSRAYALAYMACEEAGKISILIGAATRLALGVPVDWKATKRRFRSHSSKASQFLGLARALPMIFEAAEAGRKTVDDDELMLKGGMGAFVGPRLFESRNAAIYCDFRGDAFVGPGDQITEEMTDTVIKFAEINLAGANVILGSGKVEEIASFIRSRTSLDRYEKQQASAAQLAGEIVAASSVRKNV